MEDQKSIIGLRIKRLLQTPPCREPEIVEGWPRFWIELVAELENGQKVQVNEYDWTNFEGNSRTLIPAELSQEEFSLSDIEGQRIVDVLPNSEEFGDEFAIILENGLSFHCPGSPGGNGPWIMRAEDDG